MSQGVFQIDREIFRHSIWTNVAEFRVFFYIVGKAIWKEEGIQMGGIHVKRGQYLRSYRNLREDLMYMENNAVKYYSISYIKKVTDDLVADGRLKKEETKLGTLFTVVNYSKYQGFERFDQENQEQRKNAERTEQEQNKNNKKKDKKGKKDNNNTSHVDETELRYDADDINYKIAVYLREKVFEANPKSKRLPKPEPKYMQKWADEIRKIIDLDGVDKKEMYEVMRFVFSGVNWKWHTVIQSPSGLRKHWDTICSQMIDGNKNRTSSPSSSGYNTKPSKFVNYKQPELDFEELERLEQENIDKQLGLGVEHHD